MKKILIFLFAIVTSTALFANWPYDPGASGGGSDITASSIGDLNDVDTSGAAADSILKYDGAEWVVGTDADSGAGANALQNTTSGVWLSTQTLGIGTTTPAARLDVRGSILSTGPVTIQGATMTITGSGFSVGVSTFVVKEGKVGVGTTAPETPLHIYSTNLVPLALERTESGGTTASNLELRSTYGGLSDGSGAGMLFTADSNPLGVIEFERQGADNTSKILLQAYSAGDIFDALTINGNGGQMQFGQPFSPQMTYQFRSNEGTGDNVLTVSTGNVTLFAVHGTSVSLEVPLVFPDGTTQVSAVVAGSGDVVAADTSTISGMKTFSSTGGAVFNGQVTVEGTTTFKGAVGFAGAGEGSIGTPANPNALLAGATVWTFSTPVVSTGSIGASNIVGPWASFPAIQITTSVLTTGTTWFVGCAPSYSGITLRRMPHESFSVAASSINYSLQEKTGQSVNGSQIFTGTYSTATWAGGTPITSFADASIAAGGCVYLVTKPAGAIAGTPWGARFGPLEYTIDRPQ